jgi:hypothetical protein
MAGGSEATTGSDDWLGNGSEAGAATDREPRTAEGARATNANLFARF